jgi:hypothetical protein
MLAPRQSKLRMRAFRVLPLQSSHDHNLVSRCVAFAREMIVASVFFALLGAVASIPTYGLALFLNNDNRL